MVEVVPRWEWRTFGRAIDLRIDLTSYRRIRHVESSEVYLASSNAEGNPKVRDGEVDVKILQQVDDDGLEQWKPVLQAPFPLSAEQLAEVYHALGLDAPDEAAGCSLEGLLRRVDQEPRAWSVAVDKVRDQYDVDGCIVESSEVRFDGEVFRTVAAEHPDAAKVKQTVAKLGLSERENISYVEAIQRIRTGALARD